MKKVFKVVDIFCLSRRKEASGEWGILWLTIYMLYSADSLEAPSRRVEVSRSVGIWGIWRSFIVCLSGESLNCANSGVWAIVGGCANCRYTPFYHIWKPETWSLCHVCRHTASMQFRDSQREPSNGSPIILLRHICRSRKLGTLTIISNFPFTVT